MAKDRHKNRKGGDRHKPNRKRILSTALAKSKTQKQHLKRLELNVRIAKEKKKLIAKQHKKQCRDYKNEIHSLKELVVDSPELQIKKDFLYEKMNIADTPANTEDFIDSTFALVSTVIKNRKKNGTRG